MSLLKFNFRNFSPPGRLRWVSPLGGPPIVGDEKGDWLYRIKRYCQDNNIELTPDWKERAEDALCRVLPPGLCTYADGSHPAVHINVRMGADDLRHGMAVLADVVTSTLLGGNPLVEREEAERRARICAACPVNVSVQGCSSCVGLADKIVQITGGIETAAHHHLRQCGICHCSNKAQVWIKADRLAKGVTPEMMKQFELVSDFCWKSVALKELETQA